MSVLRRWNQLSRFLQLMAHTGFVSNGRPQSVVLVAEPGSGKTELLERLSNYFLPNGHLAYYSDMTFRTVIDVLKLASRGQVTHVVLPEFQKIIARKKAVAESTLAIMLQMMEEGVHTVAYGPRTIDLKGARAGILAATTVTSLRKNPYLISDLAIDSRAFFIDATGTRDELLEIERRIAVGDVRSLRKLRLTLPDRKVHVDVPAKVGLTMREWVREMEKGLVRTYGTRTFTKFMHTIKGVALADGSDVVKPRHLDEFYTFRNLWLSPPPMPDDEEAGPPGRAA